MMRYCREPTFFRSYTNRTAPFVVIVSSINSPLYSLTVFLHNIIIKTIPKAYSHIENSFKLVKELDGRYLSNKFQLMSLDVVSLFTNVPIDYAMDCIKDHWRFISRDYYLPEEEFIKAVQFVLDSVFFVFDNVIYRQNYTGLLWVLRYLPSSRV